MTRARLNVMKGVVAGLLACFSVNAQGVTGTITGVVKDPSGSLVVGASVTGRNAATNAATSTQTNADGFYRLSNLVSGEYVVEVEAKGFRKALTLPQILSTADSLRMDIALEVGQVTESVRVEAPATEVNTEDAQLGKTMRDVAELPKLSGASGRNVVLLAATQPGVVMLNDGGAFAANGQPSRANYFLLDGGGTNDLLLGATPDSVSTVSPNAVSEFRLITGARKAEYGRSAGAVVLVTTKSGGNAFHGLASEILRNTRLNAVPFFRKATPGGTSDLLSNGEARKPQWNGNDFDANLGGPILKDKTFFFVSYLGFRRREGLTSNPQVPSDAQRALIEAQGTPAAKAVLALVPRALFGTTLQTTLANSLDRDQGQVKADHAFSEANRFTASYFIDHSTTVNPFPPNIAVPGFGISNVSRFQNGVLRDTHSFSPGWFNEVRLAFHRRGERI